LRAQVPAQVNICVQTNGTLLRPGLLETLRDLGIRVGVSLDGDAEATGRHRRYANGRNSFADVADGLYLLGSAEFRDIYGGILCTIDVANDPIATYETLLKFSPPALDLLLPHANWSCPPPGSGYADWLIAVFERWYSAPEQETRIRLFSELIQLVLGQPGAVEGLGLGPSTLIVVETDGSIKQLDSLSSTYPGAADTGLHVCTDSFDAALGHPTTVARQIGTGALSPQCQACPVMRICGGGLYPHRYRSGAGFRNPSVYCADLIRLISHVSDRVIRDLTQLSVLGKSSRYAKNPLWLPAAHLHRSLQRPALASRFCITFSVRLDLGGKPDPLRGRPGLGMFGGQRLGIPAQRVGEQPVGLRLIPGGCLVDGQVGRRHQRVRMVGSQRAAATGQRLLAHPDRGRQLTAGGQVGGVVDVHGQGERMPVAVGFDEPVPGLLVVPPRLLLVSDDPEYGGQAGQRRVAEIERETGFPAPLLDLAPQFLGADQITDRPPVIDQVGGRPEGIGVLRAQVVPVALDHVLAFGKRVPMMAGLAQRGGEPLARVQPVGVLPAARGGEGPDDLARDVQ